MSILLHIDHDVFVFIVLFIILVAFGPPLTLLIIGIKKYRNEATKDKGFIFSRFILAIVYILIGFGFCGGLLT